MNQRSTFSRTKEPRREKIIRTRRDDEERFPDETPSRRSSSERPSSSHGSSFSRFKDGYSEKSRSNSRDTPGSLVFRRQERGKLQTNFSKNSAEVSPGRIPLTDSMKNDTSGRGSYISHYNRGTNNRDYTSKRSDNSHTIDESRLKNYLHRLMRDEDKERQASLMRQLRIAFENPDNFKVANSNKEEIFEILEDFIELGPVTSLNADLKQEFILAVGALGSLLGVKVRSLLDWEFDIITNSSKSDDMKTLILKTILEMLRNDADKKNLYEVVPYIMKKLQNGLEIAENSEVLIAIVKVISEIANDYSSVFREHFIDIVDILIGWHIDHTQLNSVIEFTSITLIGFHPFWRSDMNFTVTLLGQFLEDLESYAKQLAQSKLDSSETTDTEKCSAEEYIAKIKSLIKVLITVLRSIGDNLPADDNGPWSVRFVVEVLKGFLKYVKITIAYCFISDLVTSANECLVLLLKFASSYSKDALDQLMSYIDILQTKDLALYNEAYIISVLCVMIGFVKAIGTYLPTKFVTQMFSPNSTSRSLRMSPSVKVQKLLIELYHIVLAMKNVNIVEEFYNCIRLDIEEAHTELQKCKSEISMKEKSQEISLLLSICALVEMGNVKHSLIRMFALNPSFFELMINRLKPSSPDLAKRYPALQSSILFILYSHCQRHSHFVNSSELVNPNNSCSPQSTSGHSSPILQIQLNDMPPSSPNRGHLERIILLLIDLLDGVHNSYDSRLLAAKWAFEILENVQKLLPRLVSSSPFSELLDTVLNTGFTNNIIISKACCKSLHIFLKSCGHILPDRTLRRFYELCVLRMNSHSVEVQDVYASLFALLPLDIVLRGLVLNVSKSVCVQSGGKDHDISYKSHISSLDIWTTFRAHMSRISSLNFYSQHFRLITGFILQGKEPQEKNWLLRLFNSCPPAERNSRQDVLLKQLCNTSLAVLWFWAVWEVALTCVTSKLRTPLGKPQETFMAIEAALKSAAKPSKGQDGSNSEPKHTTLLRNNLLLNLMENLEKLMYNAYEGCAAAFSPSQKFLPQNVRTFFRTNKSTCHEWLGRVRSSAVAAAMNAGCPAAAVRHAFELLHELKNTGNAQGPEFESILYAVVKALILLHCPEAILGLYVWCKENLNRKFTWMKASVDCAAGRLEVAVHEYLCILQSLSEGLSLEKLKTKLNENDKSKNGATDLESSPKVNGTESAINKPKIDIYLHSFLINQIVDCYVKLQNWPDALKWSEFLDQLKFMQNGLTNQIANSSNNLSHLRCLYSFEEATAAFNKKDATTLLNNLTNSDSHNNSSWTMDDLFSKSQKTLMSVAISAEAKSKSSENIRDLTDQINDAKSSILKLMKVSALNWPFEIDSNQTNLFLSASSFQFNKKGSSLVLRENVKFDSSDCYSSNLGFLLNWENIWLRLNQTSSGKLQGGFFDLLMITARLARKKENMIMCHKLLLKALNHLCKNSLNYEVKDVNFFNNRDPLDVSSLNATIKKTLTWGFSNDKLIRIQRESAKLLHSCGESDSACDLLLSCIFEVSSYLKGSNLNNKEVDQLSELNARSILNLVKYSQQNTKFSSQDLGSKENAWHLLLSKTVQNLKSTDCSVLGAYVRNGIQQEHVVSDSDFLIGQLLQSSVQQCPALGKSWCNLASWCYLHGNKVVNSACNGSLNMLPEEKAKLISLVPNAHKEDMDVLLSIVTSLHNPLGSEWDNQETNYTENGVDEVRWQLLTYCPFLLRLDNHELVIEEIVEIWKDLVTRAYSYYRIAAISYLQYLKLNGKTVSEKMEDDNVTATLRLLRLVVKHASELRDVLEVGLAETPTTPWRGIIPQLFSRLNHPEPYVRQSISDLLCRVAHAAPHLIVFPAVVGSLTLKMGPQLEEQATGLLGAYLSEEGTEEESENPTVSEDALPDEDSEEECRRTAAMQNCFSALVETLGSQDERTICEAKRLVHELHRITLLWDELWIGTLGMHQGEVNRRFVNLEKEITKVKNNTFLSMEEKDEVIKEKHNVYVKPTLFLLEQLQTITSQPAETPHERWFQSTLEKPIENALNKLRHPEDPSRPQDSLSAFRQLYQLIQCEAQKQQSGAHLSMSHISPVLANLKNSVIPMPGINKPAASVTVQAVLDTVSILPTKTKPKKLTFIGSDGQRYAYLFKGLEDLHLDERIMQFLSIVNNMFAKSKKHGKQVFYARHYSVTPLGPRSGLIQWVDGATPLFGLYKRWQQREASASSTKKQSSSNVGAILRPSEIFYNKLTPLLKEKNINLDNRKDWPVPVLLEVLKQLMSETPDNLLAKELWCCCSSAQEWWNVTLTYNHSTAVMSMIGYIIGLGDRHLDNVLIDLATGEVVHIDYNVCFEKGKNLRVPEKVPFRMTPNIKTALGLTGIEGVFRTACEHALKSLRKGRETLLTLLEAFVYDPLVDWTPGGEGGYPGAVYGGRQAWAQEARITKQSMESEIAKAMFAIRTAEIKGEWLKNREDLLAAFPKLGTLLQGWKNAQQELQVVESALQDACQEKALLEEALANPSHSLYSVPQRYDETIIVRTTVNATKDAVVEKLNECKKWHGLHSEALAIICGSELSKKYGDVLNDQDLDNLSIAPVVEFLQSAGQGQLVQQCEQAESELVNTLHQRQLNMRTCLELLTTYATVVLQFGPFYKEKNRCFKWQNWLEELLSDFSSRKCKEFQAEFENQYGIESQDSIQLAHSLNLQLQAILNDTNSSIIAMIERMRIEEADDKNALMVYAEETKCSILHFLTESSGPCHLVFLCVFGEKLNAIRKQLCTMERAAGASGDRLVDLTSWKGDWYVDGISTMCGNLAQHVQLLMDSALIENEELKSTLEGVKLSQFVFNALEDLSLHFQNIILPEAISTALEPSVIEMVAKLDRIIARCGISLDKLIADLEFNITNLILKTPVPDNHISDTVKKLRNEFESLMQRSEPQITGLNQGQMLLMGFNGLFTKVDSDLDALLLFLDNLPVPDSWQKLDFYAETIHLAPAVHHLGARPILRDIYFVKKLIAMQQAFHVCHAFTASLHVHPRAVERDPTPLLTEHQLVKPVKQYTADYVRHMVLGLSSQALGFGMCVLASHLGCDITAEVEIRDIGVESKPPVEEILEKAVNGCAAQNLLEPQCGSLRSLFAVFDNAWHKADRARRSEQHLLVARGTQQRSQLQLARFQWLNEDFLNPGNVQNSAVSSRASLMSEIKKAVNSLVALDCVVNSAQERFMSLTAGIEQRLKWAAGANPILSVVQEEFESTIAARTSSITHANQTSRELVNLCNSVLHFEAFRTRTADAHSFDTSIVALLSRCKETCELAETCQSQISPIEEHLIAFKPLEKEGVTSDWLMSIIKLVSQSLSSCREKLELQKTATNLCWESLQLQVVHVHDLISVHHKLMSEVRHILKNLAKHEEQELGCEGMGPIQRYTTLYREFSERITGAVSRLLSGGQDTEALAAIETQLPAFGASAAEVYDQLLVIAGPLGGKLAVVETEGAKQVQQLKKNLLPPLYDSLNTLSPSLRSKTPRSGTPKKSMVSRDPRTGKAVQERNSYATNVWKRIKMKLDGRDPDPSKKSSIGEQVDFVIKEATHLENLAVLYEGWTPWV